MRKNRLSLLPVRQQSVDQGGLAPLCARGEAGASAPSAAAALSSTVWLLL